MINGHPELEQILRDELGFDNYWTFVTDYREYVKADLGLDEEEYDEFSAGQYIYGEVVTSAELLWDLVDIARKAMVKS